MTSNRSASSASFEQRLASALRKVPAGRTATVSDLAASAGRPWAAREAGRILASLARRGGADLPLHRAVRSGGSLPRGEPQRLRLVAEAARPRRGEPLEAWLGRAGATLLADLATGIYCRPGCAVIGRVRAARREPLGGAREAGARGFRPCATCAPPAPRGRPPAPLRPPGPQPPCASARLPLEAQLDRCGHALVTRFLDSRACRFFEEATADPRSQRRQVVLERHAFGRGEYGYAGGGRLGREVDRLRRRLYAALLPAAREWLARLGRRADLPDTLAAFDARSAAAGQRLPASTLLRYGPGGWNAPHRDLYGPVIFPFQAVIVVGSRPYRGGAFAVIESRDRGEDRWHLLRPRPGDAVIFPAEARPLPRGGERPAGRKAGGPRRRFRPVPVRHALLPIRSGERTALGLVLHAARK